MTHDLQPLTPEQIHRLRHTHLTLRQLAAHLDVSRASVIRAMKGIPLSPRIRRKLTKSLPKPTFDPPCVYCATATLELHNLPGSRIPCPESWRPHGDAHIRPHARIRYLPAPYNFYQIYTELGWYTADAFTPYKTAPEHPGAMDRIEAVIQAILASDDPPPTRSRIVIDGT